MDLCYAAMLGTKLGGRYKVIKILAAGGFGQTYLAEDTQRPGNPVCVVKHLNNVSQNAAYIKIARRLFQSEAQTLEKLGQHHQIPQLYAYFEENQEFYLVQEFIDGPSLSEELRQVTRLSEPLVIALLQDVLSILEFVHTYQVIHRDIKPSNLLRRQQDGRLVLIDFGAVKEIRTHLANDVDQTALSVVVGTQGYMPSEQLAGKPRFSSDIYALGMTAIQALTGLRPHQLPDNPKTSEVLWRDQAKVSDGLAAILDKMVRYHFGDRYQSAGEVLQAIKQLTEGAPTPRISPPPQENLWTRLKQQVWQKYKVWLASSSIAGCVIIVRFWGGLQSSELASLDQLFRWRPREPIDERIVIVGIDELDIQKIGQYPIPDAAIAKVLQKLHLLKPRAIGLDLYRNAAVAPGHEGLVKAMSSIPNLIGVEFFRKEQQQNIPPPPVLSQRNQVGFNNIILDGDGKTRLSLLYGDVNGQVHTSFGLRLALLYLEAKGITPQAASHNPQYLQLGKAVFRRFEPNSGGYVRADAGGYQILTNFRGPAHSFWRVSLTDVLEDKVKPNFVRDRIILIGPTAQSAKDSGYTPYSSAMEVAQAVPGVEIHANYISQILSAVLDGRPLIKVWSDPLEWLWIFGWSWVGASLGNRWRSPRWLILSLIPAGATLCGSCYLAFLGGWWLPLVPGAIALVGSGLLISRSQRQTGKKPISTRPNLPAVVEGANHVDNDLAVLPKAPASNDLPINQLTCSSQALGQVETRNFTSILPGLNLEPTSVPAPGIVNSQQALSKSLEENLPSQPVSFEADSLLTMVRGSLEPNQRQLYSFNCTKEQILTLQAVEGNVNVTVIAPDGQIFEAHNLGAQDAVTSNWQRISPEAGEYTIEVFAPHASDYTLTLSREKCN